MTLILWLLFSRENRARVNRLLHYEEGGDLDSMVPWHDFTEAERTQAVGFWS